MLKNPQKRCCQHNIITDLLVPGGSPAMLYGLNCALIGTAGDKPVYAADLIVLHFMHHSGMDYDAAFKEMLSCSKKTMVVSIMSANGMFTPTEVADGTTRMETLTELPAPGGYTC